MTKKIISLKNPNNLLCHKYPKNKEDFCPLLIKYSTDRNSKNYECFLVIFKL